VRDAFVGPTLDTVSVSREDPPWSVSREDPPWTQSFVGPTLDTVSVAIGEIDNLLPNSPLQATYPNTGYRNIYVPSTHTPSAREIDNLLPNSPLPHECQPMPSAS
jgi:hypothetical protein